MMINRVKLVLALFAIGLNGCYESPGIVEPTLQGVWVAEDYDEIVLLHNPKVAMVVFEGDELTVFYNQPNLAFQYPVDINRDKIEIESIAVHPLFRNTEYDFRAGGVVEFTGFLFDVEGQYFVPSDLDFLEAYKADFLLNEYGRWYGEKTGIFFELVDGQPTGFFRNSTGISIQIVQHHGESVIEATHSDGRVEYWPYYLRRNELMIGLGDGIARFERVYEDNIIPLN